jgi:hypothetical protein
METDVGAGNAPTNADTVVPDGHDNNNNNDMDTSAATAVGTDASPTTEEGPAVMSQSTAMGAGAAAGEGLPVPPPVTVAAISGTAGTAELPADTAAAVNQLQSLLQRTLAIEVGTAGGAVSGSGAVGKWKGFGLLTGLLGDQANNEIYLEVVNGLKKACEMNREELCLTSLKSLQAVLDDGGPDAVAAMGSSHGVSAQIDTILGELVSVRGVLLWC